MVSGTVAFIRNLPIPANLRKTAKWCLTGGGRWRPDYLAHPKYNRPKGVTICLLLSRRRTGSTALARSISEHEKAAAYREIVSGTEPPSYQHYLLDLLTTDANARSAFLQQGPLFAWPRYINHLMADAMQAKPDLKLLLFELKLETLHVFANRWSEPSLGFASSEILRLGLEIADKVLLLRRRDVLERHCSARVAVATGIYHSSAGSQALVLAERPMPKITENVARLVAKFEREIAFDRALFDYVRQIKPGAALFEYENIYRDGQFTPEFLSRFSELFPGIRLHKPALSKVRSLSAKDVLANYQAIRAAMENAPALAASLEDTP
jgi:hypothetical protein